jgi:excisionase family DNA binding protein
MSQRRPLKPSCPPRCGLCPSSEGGAEQPRVLGVSDHGAQAGAQSTNKRGLTPERPTTSGALAELAPCWLGRLPEATIGAITTPLRPPCKATLPSVSTLWAWRRRAARSPGVPRQPKKLQPGTSWLPVLPSLTGEGDSAVSDSSSTLPTGLPRPLLTVTDVAEILNLHPRSIRRMIAGGRLPVVRLGGAVRVRPEAVEELIANGGQKMSNND